MNNKTLGIAFGVLLLIYLIIKFAGGNKERSFDPEILSVDTSQVNKISIAPANGSPFELVRSADGWILNVDGKTHEATTSSVKGLLANVGSVKADRVVSKNPDRFADYNANDSLGTLIELYNGSNLLGGVVVGRFSFNQATRNGISYLRPADKQEVYSVDGFLSMSLSQDHNSYRNKEILALNRDDLTRISISALGENHTLSKMGDDWQRGDGQNMDSTQMAGYINTLGSVNGATFLEDPSLGVGPEIGEVVFEGNNIPQPIKISIYTAQDTTQDFVVHSSANEDAYFFSDSSGVYNRIVEKLVDLISSD